MRTRIVAVLAALSVVLTACGSSGGTEEGGDRAVRVGALPIVPTAAVQLGIDKGFFRERGLDLTLEMSQGGAAMLPAVVAGELDFAIGQPLPLLIANGQGLDVRIVSGYAASKPDGDDINGVFSAEGSGIERAADLAGKKVAVNTVNAAGDVTIREAVRRDGGDANSVRFVELPFPDMPAALENGNVDAVWVPEPFLTAVKQGGAQLVTYNFQDAVPGLDTLVRSRAERLSRTTRRSSRTSRRRCGSRSPTPRRTPTRCGQPSSTCSIWTLVSPSVSRSRPSPPTSTSTHSAP